MKSAILISILFLAFVGLYAQSTEENPSSKPGAPLTQYFDPEVYQAAPGNHASLQAPSGFMYFANDKGVLEFDGSFWRLIPMPNSSPVHSLAMDQSGIIFVGAQSELGYLEMTPSGQMSYRSLVEFIPQEHQNFSPVTKTIATDHGVFFHTALRLFRWKEGEMYVWPADVAFFSGYFINGQVFLLSIEDGIRKIEGDSLVLFIEKDLFGNMPVMDMIADQEGRVLLLTISGELKTFSESEGIADFQSDPLVNKYLRTNEPVDMLRLPDQRIAISTIRGGVIIINQNGTPDQIINTPTGLQEVRDLYLDQKKGLWMAMDEGIARVELYSPYSFWGKSQGLNGGVTEVIFAHNHFYIGNRKGIFRQKFDQTGYNTSTFSFIPGSPGAFSDMELHEDTLFTGAANSLNKMLADGTISGGMQLPIIQLHAYEKNPGFLMIGFQDGMGVLEQQADKITWEFTSHFPEFTTDAASFAEDSSGAVWVGSAYNGVRRFMISDFRKMADTSGYEVNPYLIDLKPEIRFYGKN
ncbi:MAG: hypothetical protein KDD99_31295, partial [Bacteroidetes bacterium]|nr:hypothetical protein [Bacteroidota bacterium]